MNTDPAIPSGSQVIVELSNPPHDTDDLKVTGGGDWCDVTGLLQAECASALL